MYKGYHLQRVDQGYSWTWKKTLLFDIGTNLDEVSLLKANLKLSAGKAGSFTFTMAKSNSSYDEIKPFLSYIDIYRDDELVFSGRITRPTLNFDTTKSFEAEGNLALLNDTILRPIEFRATDDQFMTLEYLAERLLDNHNSQVTEEKKIFKGQIEVDAGVHVYRKYEDYLSTYERFADLVESYGGYLSVTRHDDGKLYLDWLNESKRIAKQSIDFGENILDLTIEQNIDDIYSVIIPLGADIEDENTGERYRLTIESVSPDGLDYIQNDQGINNYSRIVKVVTFDDINDPQTLYNKASELLAKSVGLQYNISVNAVDLANSVSASYMNDNFEELLSTNDPYYIYGKEVIEHFRLLDKVKVHSIPHDLKDDENNSNVFDILELDLNLLNPESDNFTLGKTVGNYISNNYSKMTNYGNVIDNITKKYAVNSDTVLKIQESYDSAIQQLSDRIISQVTSILTQTGGISVDEDGVSDDSILGRIRKSESRIEQTATQVEFYFGITDSDGTRHGDAYIARYFQFGPSGFTIFGVDDVDDDEHKQNIYLEEDYDHWAIIKGQIPILQGDVRGLIGETVTVHSQIQFSEQDPSTKQEIGQWALRKGNYIPIKGGPNLNDVWIGG